MPITFGVYGNIIKVDDTLYAKNSMVGLQTKEGWRLKGNTLNTVFPYIDYTQAINEQTGEKFASETEFTDWLEQNAFWPPAGGGGGGGVQSVTGTLVTGTAQNPVVNIPTDDQIQTQIITNTGGTSPFIDLSVAMTSYGTRIYDLEQAQAGFLQSVQPGTNVTIDATDPQNPVISASGGGGTPQELTKGPGIGQVGITGGNEITINTIAADGTFSDDPSTIDLGGTGAQVFDLVGAPGVPGGTEGLLVHFQRQAAGGNGEFQFFTSDEANTPGIFSRYKADTTNFTAWDRLATWSQIHPFGLGISISEAQSTPLNDSTVGGFYVAQSTDPNKPPEFPAGLWATYLTVGFTDGSNNELASQIAVRSHTGLNFNYLGYRGFEADGTWGVWHRVYDTFNPPTPAEIGGIASVVAGTNVTVDDTDPQNPVISAAGGGSVGSLQAVTDTGNATSNAVQITGATNLVDGTDSLALWQAQGISMVAHYSGGSATSSLSLEDDQVVLITPTSRLTIRPEDGTNAGSLFQSRVSGNPAVNPTDFVTLSQTTLEAVTGQGNTTPSGIQVTGDAGIVLATDGLAMYAGSGTSTLGNLVGGSLTSALTLEAETGTQAGAAFGGRVSGQPAINPGDYVTLAQTTLQATTEQGNVTDQGINITGDQGTGPQDGISIIYNSAYPFGAISLNQGGAIVGSLEFSPGEIAFGLGGTAMTLTEEDATNAGAQFTTGVSANYFQTGQIVGGGLVIDFTNGSEIKSITGNQTYSFTNQRDGMSIQIRVNNNHASNTITVTFDGADLFGTGQIAAGEYAIFSFSQFNGVITGVQVPSQNTVAPEDIINPAAGAYVVGRTSTAAGSPAQALLMSQTPTGSTPSIVQRTPAGAIHASMFKISQQDIAGDTALDFGNACLKHTSLSADTTYTFANINNGVQMFVFLENTAAAAITITFTGANMPAGVTGEILSGTQAFFHFIALNNTVYLLGKTQY